MTPPGHENAVMLIIIQRPKLANFCASMIVEIMALAILVSDINACHHSTNSAEKTSREAPQKTEEKAQDEA